MINRLSIGVPFFLFMLVSAWNQPGHAQSMSLHDVLVSPVGSAVLEAQQKKIDYLDHHTMNLPWVDQMSIRFNTRILTNIPLSYQFSMRNNSIPMMHAQQESVKALKKLEGVEYDLLMQNDYAEKYQLLTEIYFREQKLFLQEQLKQLLMDEKAYHEKAVGINGDVSKIVHIIGVEDDVLKAEGNINLYREEIKLLQTRLGQLIQKQNIEVNTTGFIEAQTAFLQAEQLSAEANETLILKKRKMEVEISDWKRKMALREQFRIIDNFGFMYQDSIRKNDVFQQRVSFFLKLNLPLPNTNKIKRQNAKLDVLEAEKKYEIEKTKLKVSIGSAKDQMKKEWLGYQTAMAQSSKFEQEYNLEKMYKSGTPEPRLLFKVRTIQLQRKIAVEESREKFMKAYIKYLEQMGELGHKNYLSKDLEKL